MFVSGKNNIHWRRLLQLYFIHSAIKSKVIFGLYSIIFGLYSILLPCNTLVILLSCLHKGTYNSMPKKFPEKPQGRYAAEFSRKIAGGQYRIVKKMG